MSKAVVLDSKSGSRVATLLEPVLFDLIELKMHVKNAHWNLRDHAFIGIHEFLDVVAAGVELQADSVAERVRQLGSPANATSASVASAHRLPDFPLGVLNGQKAISALTESMKIAIQGVRKALTECDEKLDDPVTTDLLTRISGELEILLWKLDSHLAKGD